MPPEINPGACQGLGLCVDACPTGALEMDNGKSNLSHPEKCTDCGACEGACIMGAIKMK